MALVPKDRFKRERERRIVATIQFENVTKRSLGRYPRRFPPHELKKTNELKRTNTFIKPDLLKKSFECDCGQEINTKEKSRNIKEKINCPKCGKVFKLHKGFATSQENEIYHY